MYSARRVPFDQSNQIARSNMDASTSGPPRRRRVSSILADRLAQEQDAASNHGSRSSSSRQETVTQEREARRRDIYVPDDQTVEAIHPGRHISSVRKETRRRARQQEPSSPDFGLDLVTVSEAESESPLVSAMKQSNTRQSLAAAPRRAPLSTRSHRQSVAFSTDVSSLDGDGKENIVPMRYSGLRKEAKRRSVAVIDKEPTSAPRERVKKSKEPSNFVISQPQEPRKSKRRGSETIFTSESRSPRLRKTHLTDSTKSAHARSSPRDPPSARSISASATKTLGFMSLATPTVTPSVRAAREKSRKVAYPVLKDDVGNAEMYDDHWLDHQEVAMTQLLNSVLVPQPPFANAELRQVKLREQMLELYQAPFYPQLHKRLQASISYGALTVSKDVIEASIKLKDDVGLKRKFIGVLVETYEPAALKAAVEIVSGRMIPASAFSIAAESSTGSEKAKAKNLRALARFIDVFYIQHEGISRDRREFNTIASIARAGQDKDCSAYVWHWRRTLLKSLMLVKLLDESKAQSIMGAALFQSSSTYKSSAQVLKALGDLLVPSIGDMARPLTHLNYSLETVQHPLQDFAYGITNLAVDLRDGIRLVRLVESLLLREEQAGPQSMLSRHLKYPCIGQAQKNFNIQVALTALGAAGGVCQRLVGTMTADDISHGHREKTLSLLWGIISQVGLSSLVDWDEVRSEIRAIRATFSSHASSSFQGASSENLLLLWAQAVAASNDLRVSNLTTSFADSAVFVAIVNKYSVGLDVPGHDDADIEGSKPLLLKKKLRALGCNSSFIALIAPSTDDRAIPTRQYTLMTLAFLASRLLPLARAHRAATKIQQRWRSILAGRELKQKLRLREMAAHCATVVQTRGRVINAAVVLQRAWRAVLDKRIRGLIKDVTTFQTSARGWLARRKMAKRAKKQRKEMRVRGGW